MTTTTLELLVRELGGTLSGRPGDRAPAGVGPLAEAGPAEVAPYLDGRYREHLARSRALVVLTDEHRASHVTDAGRTAWIHPDPASALAALVDRWHPPPEPEPPLTPDERSGAWISANASVHPSVVLGPGCAIHAGARLGADVRVGEHAVVERDVRVGPRCRLRAGCWVGASRLGAGVDVGQGAVLGAEGFGLRLSGGRLLPVRHVGGVEVGDDVSIGPRCVVARATLGSTRIGSGSRIDAQVHIGHNVRIGRSCVLAAQVGIAGSAIVGDGVTIGGQAGVADHVSIGDGARVAARSGVAGNVDAGITVEGYPAMERWRWLRLVASLTRDAEE
jgi:UDP-3-O-[3-hydroxymyristoyl] glucosamine N-acyltransferase